MRNIYKLYTIVMNDCTFKLNYLYWLVIEKNLAAEAVLEIQKRMQEWLNENLRQDSIANFMWCDNYTHLLMRDGSKQAFARTIAFKHKEDLLAFMLTFDVQHYDPMFIDNSMLKAFV